MPFPSPAASDPTLQDIPPANLAATRNRRGARFLCIVTPPTLAPAHPAAYNLQPRRGTNHGVSFEPDLL